MEYFQNYWKAEDIEDFALHAAQPVPQKVTDITKEELVEVVQRISNADENVHFYLELLDQNLPHPRISNLIYWPNEEGLSDDVTAEQIVEIAMQYKPMQL
ncbi:MAG TPA: hypothetical protein DCE41_28095 [Cytophagales bacterium]|nr:hypothetical protein [Cytophagales bacterium]HAA22218.1 hypothetical protein [Cytophagales bacterium]HAP62354.1 hypothetical protein [Cytophagales bacterium]